jgi:hypothetical protein
METTTFGKDAWVKLFREAGLDEQTMNRWHHLFEAQWPKDHQRFLEWLGIGHDEAARIRHGSRKA